MTRPITTLVSWRLEALSGLLGNPLLRKTVLRDPLLILKLRRKGIRLGLLSNIMTPWIAELGIKSILDIGAYIGEFSAAMSFAFPEAEIYAFEPLGDCYQRLSRRMEGNDRFRAFNCALGRQNDSLRLQRYDYLPASSLLPATDLNKREYPFTGGARSVMVAVRPLDEIMREFAPSPPLLIKIDVQGYEREVIEGGRATIQQAEVLVVETSFEHLYHGQPLFGDIYQLLGREGFRFAGVLGQTRSVVDARIVQADSVFIRH